MAGGVSRTSLETRCTTLAKKLGEALERAQRGEIPYRRALVLARAYILTSETDTHRPRAEVVVARIDAALGTDGISSDRDLTRFNGEETKP